MTNEKKKYSYCLEPLQLLRQVLQKRLGITFVILNRLDAWFLLRKALPNWSMESFTNANKDIVFHSNHLNSFLMEFNRCKKQLAIFLFRRVRI